MNRLSKFFFVPLEYLTSDRHTYDRDYLSVNLNALVLATFTIRQLWDSLQILA
ncbi:hypothetical protein K7432_008910, partial [Basidiobolus ranarum]